ncbi:unnamed protein product [Lactuca virosa]|uniref:Nucleoplasmin-like domain-containing protein n=1 Tax=Lactuca virosa TaxID=75947 RepID=A0AAU9PBB9_9ASTR|nr:unnamed protein product [Lactuca virosa]
MSYWGIEVFNDTPLDYKVRTGRGLRISKAALVEKNKGTEEYFSVFITFNGRKVVVGNLHPQLMPIQEMNLLFDCDIQLSHNWENGTVHFSGCEEFIDDYTYFNVDDEEKEPKSKVREDEGPSSVSECPTHSCSFCKKSFKEKDSRARK